MAVGADLKLAEVLFEYRRIGAQMRVAALDPATGTEVVVIVPASATEAQVRTLAIAKLRKRLSQGQGA
jgi:hypothetical protein